MAGSGHCNGIVASQELQPALAIVNDVEFESRRRALILERDVAQAQDLVGEQEIDDIVGLRQEAIEENEQDRAAKKIDCAVDVEDVELPGRQSCDLDFKVARFLCDVAEDVERARGEAGAERAAILTMSPVTDPLPLTWTCELPEIVAWPVEPGCWPIVQLACPLPPSIETELPPETLSVPSARKPMPKKASSPAGGVIVKLDPPLTVIAPSVLRAITRFSAAASQGFADKHDMLIPASHFGGIPNMRIVIGEFTIQMNNCYVSPVDDGETLGRLPATPTLLNEELKEPSR